MFSNPDLVIAFEAISASTSDILVAITVVNMYFLLLIIASLRGSLSSRYGGMQFFELGGSGFFKGTPYGFF